MGKDQQAATMDVDAWKAFGGTVDGKVYVAPSGERLKTWKAAVKMMADKQKDAPASGKKRAAEPAEEAKPAPGKENKKAKDTPSAPAPKSAKKAKAEPAAEAEPMATDDNEDDVKGAAANGATVGSGRRAAQGVQYKDKDASSARVRKDDFIVVEDEPEADSEADAIRETQGERPSSTRRLLNFTIADKAGVVQPLDRVALLKDEPLFVTGAVYPEEGAVNRPDGRRVEKFGPVKGWTMTPPTRGATSSTIKLTTQLGCYVLSRPLPAYKKVWAELQGQVALAAEVMAAVDPALGGNSAATFDEVVSRVARVKAVYAKAYSSAREALLLNGRFILGRLEAADEARRGPGAASASAKEKGKAAAGVTEWAFYKGLEAELGKGPVGVGAMMSANGGIKIADDGEKGSKSTGKKGSKAAAASAAADEAMAADEEMARRLQAQMDAQAYAAANRGRGGSAAAAAAASYIKISEEEIADDYPMPKQYEKEDEEVDELALLWDEELAVMDPEDLPRRLITDFSVYNAEGFMTTLELLPMWAGVDPDVEVFMSGVVKDDDGDWGVGGQGLGAEDEAADKASGEGGSSGAGGSSGGAGEAAADKADPVAVGGTRMFLSQIREWVVEFSADQLFLSVRTDAGWYKLCSPAAKYSPWFKVPLKAARLAVKVISMLSEAERASRLSFSDVIKALAAEPESSPLFISKKADRVERFVVVHGQIFLNQIKAFPKQEVQRSPFVTGLKTAMEARRHNKLYYSKKGFSRVARASSAVNRNPMKDRASGRAKPMPATATRMVLSIWENYFNVGEGGAGLAAAAAAKGEGVAQEVEEDPNEEDEAAAEDDHEDALAGGKKGKKAATAAAKAKKISAAAAKRAQSKKPEWVGASTGADAEGRALYRAAKVGGWTVSLGDVVQLPAPEEDDDDDSDSEAPAPAPAKRDGDGDAQMADAPAAAAAPVKREKLPPVGLVQCLLQDKSGEKVAQVRLLLPGSETVLGDAAADTELFVTDDYTTLPLAGLPGVTLDAKRMQRTWAADLRCKYYEEDEAMRKANLAAAAAGKPLQYFYRHWYRPQKGMFCVLPEDLGLGSFVEAPAAPIVLGMTADGKGFIKDGVTYAPGDFLFLQPGTFDALEEEEEEEDSSSSEDASDDEDAASSESEEEEEAKPAAKGKRAQPARAGAKGKASASKAKKAADGSDEEEEEESEDGGDDSADEDFKAKGGKKAAAKKEKKAAPAKKAAKKAKASTSSKKASAKNVKYADGRKGRFVKGSCEGLRAYVIARVVEVKPASTGKGALPASVRVERFFRPEDVSADRAYAADFWDVYAPAAPAKGAAKAAEGSAWVKPAQVAAKCIVGPAGAPKDADLPTFAVVGSYNPATNAAGDVPAEFAPGAAAGAKGKGKAAAAAAQAPAPAAAADHDGLAMRTMDIFAGCGGLSEGMHQAGVADTRWAIEYEAPAADAFKLNNPDAEVFCANCNVILRAAMEKAGLSHDCCAHEDAVQGALQMAPDRVAALPRPGEVEFIMGGPPCQGYSGMNRFNKGNWSMVQNSMVMAFLSYADFYRPRYFLLENVRNFVSHNKSFTFRLTVRTLLDMGYQVRFGVLNAGNYGVPQSRKRTFIWAAAPEEQLPEWPQQLYVFRSPQLTINLPGGVQYTAVPQREGAPLRTVTVKDAIGDLPVIKNGHDLEQMDYTGEPVSAFQRKIRNGATKLRDHICKEMNPLNLERCRCIPKDTPGADWRVLLEIVKNDPSREKFNGQPLVPWCLPNTADRHNGWRGLFGRLDMAGHFPTSTTDPQPMGKVGQVFHPHQDRIVSVRECARSQGFPDTHFFSGNVHNRHRQVGNAVPPPLAAALGGQLRRALEKTHARQLDALAAQM